MMTIGQHVVHAGKSIPVQILNSLQGRQVHYTDTAAGHQMTGWSSAF